MRDDYPGAADGAPPRQSVVPDLVMRNLRHTLTRSLTPARTRSGGQGGNDGILEEAKEGEQSVRGESDQGQAFDKDEASGRARQPGSNALSGRAFASLW